MVKKKRLGTYQRAVLKGIKREGKQPITIKYGYSRQYKSLLRRKLIAKKGKYLYLTKKGKKRLP